MGTMFKNLILHDYQEKSFYHALRTKGFVILAGLSGTGKTKIFEEMGANIEIWKVDKELEEQIVKAIQFFKLDKITDMTLHDWHGSKGDGLLNLIANPEQGSIFNPDNKSPNKKSDFKKLYDFCNKYNEGIDIKFKNLLQNFYLVHGISSSDSSKNKWYIYNNQEPIKNPDEEFIKVKNLLYVIKEVSSSNVFCLADYIMNYKQAWNENRVFSKHFLKLFFFLYAPHRFTEIFDLDEIEKLRDFFSQSNQQKTNFFKKLFFPIRPDFKDSKSLLGYYNPLKGEYHTTELLNFILNSQKEFVTKGKNASPYLVLFDEMNLARVEYYFADFLSVLESKRVENESDVNDEMRNNVKDKNNNKVSKDKLIGFYSKPIILHNENLPDIPQKLYLPPNLYFIGSVNIDETTYMFSPKVLDRAFTIEFDADMEMYIQRISKQNSGEPCCIKNQEEKTEEISKETIKHEKERDVTEVGSSTKQDTSAEAPNTNPSQDSSNPTDDNNPLCFELSDFIRWGKFAVIQKDCVRNIAKNGSLSYKVNNQQLKKSYKDILNEIFSILQPYGLHFGYRVFDEVMMFMCNATVDTKYKMDSTEALDLAIKMKILPKFHGTRQKLETPIKKLIIYCKEVNMGTVVSVNIGGSGSLQNQPAYLSPKSIPILKEDPTKQTKYIVELDGSQHVFLFPHTARKLIEMFYKLQTQGFASFM